jgi:hypothetical protein
VRSAPLYLETVHQENARAAGLLVDNYWANGPVGTPAALAARVMGSGQVRAGDTFWWDVEDWPENDVKRWTPGEVEERALALAVAGKPIEEQGIYLNLSLVNSGAYTEMVQRLGMKLWLAQYTDAEYTLIRGGWSQRPALWQFTSSSCPQLREVYDANLDVNRSGSFVWIVEDLQRALNKISGTRLTIDNDYGSRTTEAVWNYQRSAGLQVDGNAGPATVTSLVEAGA